MNRPTGVPVNDWPVLGWPSRGGLQTLTSVFAILLAGYILFYAGSKFILQGRHAIVVILCSLLVLFFGELAVGERETLAEQVDFVVVVLLLLFSAMTFSYFFFAYPSLLNRVLLYRPLEYGLATVVILVSIEAVRRTYGRGLTAIVISSLFYAFGGRILPGILYHEGLSVARILEINVLTLGGTFGFIPQIGATWVAIFLIYGGILDAYGALELCKRLGGVLSDHFRSGVAQFAVIASLVMGTITGVAAANTATTGSFTIPLMKEHGIRDDTAGAIESIASSGGQVMPPVMGVSVFIMASILELSYVEIITASLLPAILYYLSLVTVVHITSLQQGATRPTEDDFTHKSEARLSEALPILVSVICLIYFLVWARYGPLQSAFNATGLLIGTQFVWTLTQDGEPVTAFTDTLRDTVHGLEIGGTTLSRIVPALVGISVMVEMVQVGSFVQEMTFAMLSLSGGQLLLLLGIAMALSLILGMGAPTVVAYLVVAVTVGPAMIRFGLEPIYGHLFVFYFAVLSSITPPFAVACLVACGISGADFLETCREAIVLATPLYALPYAFVVHPNLLVWDLLTPITFGLTYLGLVSAVVGSLGYPRRQTSIFLRVALVIAASVILLSQSLLLNAFGAAMSVVLLGYLYLRQ